MYYEKLPIDVFEKPNKSFPCGKPSTCYTRKNINNVPRGAALKLPRICDTISGLYLKLNECKQYLIESDYKPSLVNSFLMFQE